MSGRSGSGASSRSTSFSLPNDVNDVGNGAEDSGEIEEDEPLDPEGKFYLINVLSYHIQSVRLAEAKHRAFLQARGRHYSNEAEAMKVRTCCCLSRLYCRARL